MNANVAVREKPTKVDEYRMQVLPPQKAEDLWRSLPAHIKPEVFERNLLNALMANPDLMGFPPALVYREVSKAAGLGLLLDPQLGEAYIVTAYNYKSKRVEPQLRVGYKGMCKLARQTGGVGAIYAHEVCANDQVECDLGFPKVFHHRPILFGDRGDVIGYVAVITYKDGTFDFEPMSVDQAQGIRDRSDAWKAFKDGKIKSTPWATDEGEMSKKTVLRRLLKRQSQSPELATAIRIEDDAEFPSFQAIPAPRPPAPPAPPAISHETEEPGAGEQDGAPIVPEAAPTAPKPNRRERQHAAAAVAGMPEPDTDPEAFLKWLDGALGKIETGAALEAFWNDHIAPLENGLFPPDRDEAIGIYRRHEGRLS